MHDQTNTDDREALRTELASALEREAATREILYVISQSRNDEQPVFDRIVELARELCGAYFAALILGRKGDEVQRLAASHNLPDDVTQLFHDGQFAMDPARSITPNAILDRKVIHIEDMAKTPEYLRGDVRFTPMVDNAGIRSNLFVPLIHNGEGVGALLLGRNEVRSYSEDEISLVETFASQAVIAIENVRQFRLVQRANVELQTRLEREAATASVLQVISQSRADETPVFNSILRSATRLCHAPLAFLSLVDETGMYLSIPAHKGARPEMQETFAGLRQSIAESEIVSAHVVREKSIIRIDDMASDAKFDRSDPHRAELIEVEGVRSYLVVPMLRSDNCLGTLNLYRREVDPFSDDDVALAETFAHQALIAIENVRQFRALQDRTADVEALNANLETRVVEQVGEIERMGRLKRFLPAAVADTIVSSGSEKMLSSHRAFLGVLFCDIRGFTAFCETAEPEETIEVLQSYHEEMGKLINAHGAGVDHRMGDGIMVLFNDPLPCNNPAGDSVRLAIAMRSRMAELCAKWKRLGHRLGFGVGVSLGYATVGMVGFEGRFDYTASGTAINLASRLCDEAEDGEVLLSPRAGIAVEDDFKIETKGEMRLKGIREPMEIFRLTKSLQHKKT